MRRIAFNVALSVSLAALALFAFGFVGEIGLVLTRTGTVSRVQTISFERGRFTIWTETWPTQLNEDADRFSIEPTARFRLRIPRIDGHAIGGFDAHALPATFPVSRYLVACPIWAMALPFLIAPAIWLRRRLAERRRKRLQHGFPVNSIDAEPQPQ